MSELSFRAEIRQRRNWLPEGNGINILEGSKPFSSNILFRSSVCENLSIIPEDESQFLYQHHRPRAGSVHSSMSSQESYNSYTSHDCLADDINWMRYNYNETPCSDMRYSCNETPCTEMRNSYNETPCTQYNFSETPSPSPEYLNNLQFDFSNFLVLSQFDQNTLHQ